MAWLSRRLPRASGLRLSVLVHHLLVFPPHLCYDTVMSSSDPASHLLALSEDAFANLCAWIDRLLPTFEPKERLRHQENLAALGPTWAPTAIEIESIARDAVRRAAATYVDGRGTTFSTWCHWQARTAIREHWRRVDPDSFNAHRRARAALAIAIDDAVFVEIHAAALRWCATIANAKHRRLWRLRLQGRTFEECAARCDFVDRRTAQTAWRRLAA